MCSENWHSCSIYSWGFNGLWTHPISSLPRFGSNRDDVNAILSTWIVCEESNWDNVVGSKSVKLKIFLSITSSCFSMWHITKTSMYFLTWFVWIYLLHWLLPTLKTKNYYFFSKSKYYVWLEEFEFWFLCFFYLQLLPSILNQHPLWIVSCMCRLQVNTKFPTPSRHFHKDLRKMLVN